MKLYPQCIRKYSIIDVVIVNPTELIQIGRLEELQIDLFYLDPLADSAFGWYPLAQQQGQFYHDQQG